MLISNQQDEIQQRLVECAKERAIKHTNTTGNN